MKLILIIILSLLTGCATYSHEIIPANISTSMFNKMNCDELEKEISKNLDEQAVVRTKVDEIAASDRAIGWFGALIMPIALLAIHGDKIEAANLSTLKGNLLALSQVASDKNCKEAIELSIKKDKIICEKIAAITRENEKQTATTDETDDF